MKARIRKTGFALLELLVVIVILSVMVSILIPSMSSNDRKAMDSAESLMLMINMAQQEAIMTSRVWQLIVDLEQDNYRFQQLGNMEFEDITTRPLAGDHFIGPAEFQTVQINGQHVNSETAEVYLYPTGEQDAMQLVLESDGIEYLVAMGPVGPA
ncbi:MAG: prepilin-type N-terminal cleavage/methylation domain-containing protein, partial [Gammaproteobacteria bacterium]|nr:prepilin-type N-terminal cleavage/methylation domain-containing protein [Gammaproteobacteria bacterium]